MDVSISTGAHEYPFLTTELRKMVKELVHRKSREWLQTEEEAEYPGAKPKSPQLAHSTRLLRAMRYILPKRPFLAHLKAAPEPPPSNAPLNECLPSSSGRHRIEKVQRAGTSVQLLKGRLQKQMYRPRVRRVEQNVVLPPSLVAQRARRWRMGLQRPALAQTRSNEIPLSALIRSRGSVRRMMPPCRGAATLEWVDGLIDADEGPDV